MTSGNTKGTTTLSHEQISGLVDNHHEGFDLQSGLTNLGSESELQGKWARYHTIRDVLQKDYTSGLPADFASRVSAAIDEDIAGDDPFSADQAAANVSSLGQARVNKASAAKKPAATTSWRKNLTGFAVAASVALVALVGLNVFQGTDTTAPDLVALSSNGAETLPAGGAPSDPSVVVFNNGTGIELVSNSGTYWVATGENKLSPANERRLNSYLSQHIEHSPTSGVQGMLPYSRLAGYDSAASRQKQSGE